MAGESRSFPIGGFGLHVTRSFRAVAGTIALAALGFSLCVSPAVAAEDATSTDCGSKVTPAPARPKQVDLVLDDSGSMFWDPETKSPLTRWSYAKYALEAFATMLGPDTTLNVFLMSDFAQGRTAGPAVTLQGSDDVAQRQQLIHNLVLNGGGTPYAPVQAAMADLSQSSAPEKWLVVATDGEFEDRLPDEVNTDLRQFVKDGSSGLQDVNVAFLAMGADAVTIPNDPKGGIHFAKAVEVDDLLGQMAQFSNTIFGRDFLPGGSGKTWSPDIDLAEVVVFAQGPSVAIGPMTTVDGAIEPSSVVDVSWADNPPVGARQYVAVPEQALVGKVATFYDVPKGEITVDVQGEQALAVFYQPKVDFGITLRDGAGNQVSEDKLVSGTYSVDYGFMDQDCNIIESTLLGDVKYSAVVTQDGKVVKEAFKPGEKIDLSRGDVAMDVTAEYLDGAKSSAHADVKVLQAAAPTQAQVDSSSYKVSEMAEFPPESRAVEFQYTHEGPNGEAIPFSPEEWSAIPESALGATSDANLDFKVVKGQEVGSVFLYARAPEGNVYAATTGPIEVAVSAEYEFDEQMNTTSALATIDVIDDLSALDRWKHWWSTVGWKYLLLLLLFILILGYVFKKRFSKKVKRHPTVRLTPRQYGIPADDGRGKFVIEPVRRWLPFVADRAKLVYVPPGVSGFTPMRLKAGPGKQMILTNWREVAKRENVSINGNDLNKETNRGMRVGPSSMITATDPTMTYDITPNQ